MKNFRKLIIQALKEDNAHNDITTQAVIHPALATRARLIAKSPGIVCGLEIFGEVFKTLDPSFTIKNFVNDGQRIRKGQFIAEISGPVRALLAGERTALNFLQHLSGIATLTSKFVEKTKGTPAKIYDTRKTLPGLREFQKYAVRCGGGCNHRMSLMDMALLKDNHLNLVQDMQSAVRRIRAKKPDIEIEVECENFSQVKEALESHVDIIMLDNMDIPSLRRAIALIKKREKRPDIEVSGGINLKMLRKFARLGIDRISVGALTHSVPALDISLEII